MELKYFLKSKDSEHTPYPLFLVIDAKIMLKALILIQKQTMN
ncbi:hypothetical protein [Companilactobacillus zhachilii]|nr:hypothetical protein [Companilactobacillus zhachilii]